MKIIGVDKTSQYEARLLSERPMITAATPDNDSIEVERKMHQGPKYIMDERQWLETL